MDTPLVKGIVIGVALFLLVAVLTIAIFAFNIGQDASKSSTQELTTISTDMQEQKYLVYDNMELSGSSVSNTIKKLENDGKANKIGVHVKTLQNPNGTWYYNTFSGSNGSGSLSEGASGVLANTYDIKNSNEYINPSGKFTGQVFRDKNNAIRAVIFTQK